MAKKEKEEATVYGVSDLAEALDLEPHIVRTKLRQHDIEKTEGKYAWPSKEYKEVLAKLKGGNGKKAVVEDEPKAKGGKKAVEKKAAEKAPENKSAGKTRPRPGGAK